MGIFVNSTPPFIIKKKSWKAEHYITSNYTFCSYSFFFLYFQSNFQSPTSMTEQVTDLVMLLDFIVAQLAQQEKNLSLGFDGEVQKLQDGFKIFQMLLNDAEKRRILHDR